MIIGISGKIGSGKDTIGHMITLASIPTVEKLSYKEALKLGFGVEASEWKIKKFADKLKDIVCILTGCSRVDLEFQEFKNRLLPEEWQVWEITNWNRTKRFFHTESEAIEFCTTYNNSQNDYRYRKSERTYRWLLQYLGTDLLREKLHQNIHITALFADYKCNLIKPSNLSCVSDRDFEFFSQHCFNRIFIQPNRPYSVIEFLKLKVQNGLTEHMYETWKKAINNAFPKWIIPDLRFPNELEAIKKRGGITIRVVRESVPFASHPSETALDHAEFDYTILNNGTLDELFKEVKKVYNDIRLRYETR